MLTSGLAAPYAVIARSVPAALPLLLLLASACRSGGAPAAAPAPFAARGGAQARGPRESQPQRGGHGWADTATVTPGSRLEAAVVEPTECTPKSGAACLRAAQELAERDPVAAESALRGCVTCAAAPSAAHRLLAAVLEERGAGPEALEVLRRAARSFPHDAPTQLALARLAQELGRGPESLSAYDAALRLRPEDPALEQERDAAVARFGSAVEQLEVGVAPLLREAEERAELQDLEGAGEALRAALTLAAHEPRVAAVIRHRLAIVLVRQAEPARALAELERVLAVDGIAAELRAEVLVMSSEVLLGLGRAAEAAAAAEASIELAPEGSAGHTNLAIAYALLGRQHQAIEALSRAIDRGLARRITRAQLLAIGPAIEVMKRHPDFAALLRSAWPDDAVPTSGERTSPR